jgi:DNA-directed RNA polymerase subunit RPC12/RpoP
MQAIWDNDYDSRTDSIYKRPCCPECGEPILLFGDAYHCVSCGEKVEVTNPEMEKWFDDRAEIRYEQKDCPRMPLDDEGKEFMGCGGKGTLRVLYVRNKATLEWQEAQGECEKCGLKFIV